MADGLIEPRKKAPAFRLQDQDGKTHRLSDYKDQTVVLYFYPKDDTSGCTIEACEMRDHLPRFRKGEAAILGISPDDVKSHRKFADKFDLNFTLLADVRDDAGNAPVCSKYGVWREKSMYGRQYLGVVRTTYIIGPGGIVRHRFDNVKPAGHAQEVLTWLRDNPSDP